MKVIESFAVSLYVTESDISSSVDIARYQIFKYRGNSEICSLPPARDALCLVIYGEHHTYRQKRKSHQQIVHGLSLIIE